MSGRGPDTQLGLGDFPDTEHVLERETAPADVQLELGTFAAPAVAITETGARVLQGTFQADTDNDNDREDS